MADYQKVEINEPTQAEIEPDQQQATEAEEPQAQQERPEWLPEKFESAEDLAKAYGELESKMGTGAKEEEPEQQEEKPEQSENEFTETQKLISDASKHYYENGGEIPDETYEALEKAGIGRDLVDRFKAGQESLEEVEINQIRGSAGDEYDAMSDWAGKNLDDDEFNAFNEVVNNGTVQQAKLAVKGLYARYKSEVGSTGPKLVTGGTTGSSTMPFGSMQEVSRYMKDPKYKSGDKAYHAELDRRLAASNF
jgi:hypothetical protein